MTARTCTDRQCGNNPNRRVNPNDYDSAMGLLCDACEDAAAASTGNPRDLCVNCGEYMQMSDELGVAAQPLGIAFMYPGLVAEGF